MNTAEQLHEPTLFEQDQAVKELGLSDESNESYHSSAGISFSGLKNFAKTPAHFLVLRNEEKEETASQRLGTLAHMAILEPERFSKSVAIVDGHRGKTSVKEAIAEAEMAGKYVCKPDEYSDALRMADGVLNHKFARELLKGGVAEQSLRWRDAETGILMKCRPDYLRTSDGIVVDLKTFENLTDDRIQKQILKMKYHWQSAFYLGGVNQYLGLKDNRMFAHIFIDTVVHKCRVVILDDASLEKADSEIRPLVQSYAHFLKLNEWPAYAEEISTVNLPHFGW